MGDKTKYVWRRWRGNGSIIADVMKPKYYDYPKHRKKRPYLLSEVFVKEITKEQYLLELKMNACDDHVLRIQLFKEYDEKFNKK